jgi:two-component system cell cycle response regulator DivK
MQGSTIFIFDDDQDILLMCGIVLKQQGYTVATSDVCDDIVNRVSTVNPDVVIMDNKIPPYGGISATKTLKGDPSTKNIPVLFFSANTQVEQLSREAGADAYIQKPFNLDEFEKAISDLVNK